MTGRVLGWLRRVFAASHLAHPRRTACLNLPCAADEESMGAGEAAGHTRAPAQTSGAQAGGHGHGGHGEEFEFGEVMVHQVGG